MMLKRVKLMTMSVAVFTATILTFITVWMKLDMTPAQVTVVAPPSDNFNLDQIKTRRLQEVNDSEATKVYLVKPKNTASTHPFKGNIVIIGSGPAGLGAAYRLLELLGANTTINDVLILEQEEHAGRLASSYRDPRGFPWDNGGHVVFSHYAYFNKLLNTAVKDWTTHSRASFAYMKGSSGERRFIPYPVQNNIHLMDAVEQRKSLEGLANITARRNQSKSKNFDQWLIKNFGEGLCEVFMRKYNRKVWTVKTSEMNADWVGERSRVAVPDIADIKKKIRLNASKVNTSEESVNHLLITNRKGPRDSNWGPNQIFQFPVKSGIGRIWIKVSKLIPQSLFRFKHEVVKVFTKNKLLHVKTDSGLVKIQYRSLISTLPLDNLVKMITDDSTKLPTLQKAASKFIFSHTHVIGIDLSGKPPPTLSDKSWIYFPDDDSPFYRATVFSNYADDNIPAPHTTWSLMCEAAEEKLAGDPTKWLKKNIINETITALVNYNFLKRDEVISTYHRRLEHGYPVPFLEREKYLKKIQPWLEKNDIYSRGRFGGWRYEVGNQDHSVMQGVEIADKLVCGTEEVTYFQPGIVNSMKAFNRSMKFADREYVVAHYRERLNWTKPFAQDMIIYHKGGQDHMETIDDSFKYKRVELLPNVGRESHTYLYHIINNYYCLADCTFFLQGEINNHIGGNWCFHDMSSCLTQCKQKGLIYASPFTENYFGPIRHIGKWLKQIERGEIRRAKIKSLGEFWLEVFDKPHPPYIKVSAGAIFAVSREQIHRRPISFYEKLIKFVDHHPNPEEGHYFERLWVSIFT